MAPAPPGGEAARCRVCIAALDQGVGAERCKGSTSYSPTALAAYRDASFLLHPSRWTRPPGAAGLTSVIATFENP